MDRAMMYENPNESPKAAANVNNSPSPGLASYVIAGVQFMSVFAGVLLVAFVGLFAIWPIDDSPAGDAVAKGRAYWLIPWYWLGAVLLATVLAALTVRGALRKRRAALLVRNAEQ